MNLMPIVEAPLAIQIHLATIIPAFFLGTWLIFFSRKGAPATAQSRASSIVIVATGSSSVELARCAQS